MNEGPWFMDYDVPGAAFDSAMWTTDYRAPMDPVADLVASYAAGLDPAVSEGIEANGWNPGPAPLGAFSIIASYVEPNLRHEAVVADAAKRAADAWMDQDTVDGPYRARKFWDPVAERLMAAEAFGDAFAPLEPKLDKAADERLAQRANRTRQVGAFGDVVPGDALSAGLSEYWFSLDDDRDPGGWMAPGEGLGVPAASREAAKLDSALGPGWREAGKVVHANLGETPANLLRSATHEIAHFDADAAGLAAGADHLDPGFMAEAREKYREKKTGLYPVDYTYRKYMSQLGEAAARTYGEVQENPGLSIWRDPVTALRAIAVRDGIMPEGGRLLDALEFRRGKNPMLDQIAGMIGARPSPDAWEFQTSQIGGMVGYDGKLARLWLSDVGFGH